ncbi:MAG: polyhydroxyalkanoate depolymerase [Proteobacteria bacterium]|nr:polyhydroxyalkanoate depolymerase [Pseudomonadota bacterium]MDA1058107.1 polyhydroxyalkanoate depolymerase [Pseudomonadota bacterium]
MLYSAHEFQQAARASLRTVMQAGQMAFRHPLNPLTHTDFGRRTAAAFELVDYTTQRRSKPQFGLTSVETAAGPVPITEVSVLDEPFCKLLHFDRPGCEKLPRLLVVAPLSGHFATLLRGTVEGLLPQHDVYITDWIDARDVPVARGRFSLDDYITYVMRFLRHLGPGTHVMAVCQPSVPVLAAAALMAEDGDPARPKSMILMGGPIDTRINPTAPNDLAQSQPLSWFERNVITTVPMTYPGFSRQVYPGFLQLTGFMTMNLERHMNAHWDLYDHLIEGDGESVASHQKFYDEYLSVMDLPAEYYLQTVKTVFQEHALPEGKFYWGDRRVDPGAITDIGLLTVEGELDDISGLGQTRAAHDLCHNLPAAKKRHHEQAQTGHYGIFNGRRWRSDILPLVHETVLANA